MNQGKLQYLNIIKRWWWLLVVGAIIPMAITYYLVSQQPDVYQAEATLVVGRSVFRDPNPDTREMDLSNTLAAAYAELLTRRTVLERVIQRLGLRTTPERLTKQIAVNIRSGAQLLEIQVLDANPEMAALIANALADELIRQSPTSEETLLEKQKFVETQLEGLEAKINEVDAQIAVWTASLAELTSAAEIQETQARIDALEQVKTRYQDTYVGLLGVSQEESPNELSLFESAVAPSLPVPRQTKLMVAVSGVAGAGLAFGAVLLMEYLDTSLRWGKEGAQSISGLRVLGTIPQVPKRESFLSGDPLSPIADSIRALWVSVFLMHPQRRYRTLLLTSPRSGEGKSFLVANLAIALAAAGNRVVAIDMDMRKSTLHELFNRPNIIGLSEMLSRVGDITWDVSEIPLRETGFGNLRILSAGRLAADPTALLTSSRLPALLDCLKDEADVVLIDSPPILEVPDARPVAMLVEGTILVVSAGTTRRESIQRAKEELLVHEGINLLGVVVNRVKQRKDYYYSTYARGSKQEKPKSRGKRSARGWLTPGEAAVVLGISKSMTCEWCKDGRLPATRKWLSWRVDRDGFAQMLEDTWDGKPIPKWASERVKDI
jgi:succinoglycan biosynthesis transport protein ExoP